MLDWIRACSGGYSFSPISLSFTRKLFTRKFCQQEQALVFKFTYWLNIWRHNGQLTTDCQWAGWPWTFLYLWRTLNLKIQHGIWFISMKGREEEPKSSLHLFWSLPVKPNRSGNAQMQHSPLFLNSHPNKIPCRSGRLLTPLFRATLMARDVRRAWHLPCSSTPLPVIPRFGRNRQTGWYPARWGGNRCLTTLKAASKSLKAPEPMPASLLSGELARCKQAPFCDVRWRLRHSHPWWASSKARLTQESERVICSPFTVIAISIV